jgi:hypothetical protein
MSGEKERLFHVRGWKVKFDFVILKQLKPEIVTYLRMEWDDNYCLKFVFTLKKTLKFFLLKLSIKSPNKKS